ncbi:hypothetical protein DUI87_21105 [Hirundo rustica rustica]|uniref:EGF-like domain-containing protein n=1 Tax=Hirundo rustica rustica TaxID=333673 RepID=A0A3M0JLX8_HIRRU|nr:hypothetical protein DUI87_21105 [Hirundo rustica rustica]
MLTQNPGWEFCPSSAPSKVWDKEKLSGECCPISFWQPMTGKGRLLIIHWQTRGASKPKDSAVGKALDVNECTTENGGCHDRCCNTIGSYHCKCPAGQKLGEDGKSCADVDECEVLNGGCQQGCANTHGSFQCQCRAGFRLHADGRTCIGDKFSQVVDVHSFTASLAPAVNSCSINNGGCEQDCVQLSEDHYKCQCQPGYQLKTDAKSCEGALDVMAGRTGDPDVHSLAVTDWKFCPMPGSVQGQAGWGLEQAGIMEDVDECAGGRGRCAHRCVNTPGSFSCACSPGFELGADGRQCYQVDECETGESCCSQFCINYAGGYECACKAGFQLSADGCSCDDVDECRLDNGNCDHFCVNSLGSYECACKEGYRQGDSRWACVGVEEADAEEAAPGLQFRGPPQLLRYALGSLAEDGDPRGELTLVHRVVCLGDTFGQDCSLRCEDCLHGGRCNSERSGCVCTPGWAGVICNETCPPGTFGRGCAGACQCRNGGSCDPGTGQCRCPPGVLGRLCEDGCPKGFFGKNCNKPCNCANKGHCHRLYGACLCDPGLYGRFCHLTCPRWAFGAGCSEECQCVKEHTLECSPRNGSCTCQPGYHGKKCQKDFSLARQDCVAFIAVILLVSLAALGWAAGRGAAVEEPRVIPRQDSVFAQLGRLVLRVSKVCEVLDQDCPDGQWGPDCQSSCQPCANGGQCNRETGACDCPPGYTGPSCSANNSQSHTIIIIIIITITPSTGQFPSSPIAGDTFAPGLLFHETLL